MNKFFYLVFLITLGMGKLSAQTYERYKKLKDTTISSEYLGFDKNISVIVPVEWQEDIDYKFPLIIVFDQQNRRSHNYILNTIDYLTSNEQMPSSVVVSVESAQEYRYPETLHHVSSENGHAEENERFIFSELIPLAENRFKASGFRLLIGHSRYGYFTTSLLLSHTEELNGVISLSPFFSQKNVNLIDSIAKLNDVNFGNTKYYCFGIGNDYPEDYYAMDSVLKAMENPLFHYKGMLFPEAYHNTTPGLIIAISLYEVFEKWFEIQSRYLSEDNQEVTIIPMLEKAMVEHYGCKLNFALGILNGKGWYFYGNKDYKKAIQAWDALVNYYPNFSEGYLYILEAQMKLDLDTSTTVIKFKESLHSSVFYSKKEKDDLLLELEELLK